MGLNITYNCWNGAYSSFNKFRYFLGYQIGIDLDDYEGYKDNGTKRLDSIKHPLMPLFNHSDCDGRLTIKESRSIIEGLDDVLSNFNEDIDTDHCLRNRIIQFRDGCINAVNDRSMIYFK